jgi:RNA polymerase-binding transcription factor
MKQSVLALNSSLIPHPFRVPEGHLKTMEKRKVKVYRDRLLGRREGLVGQVMEAEQYSRERDSEATQDPADMAANAYTKELLFSMSANDRRLLELIDEALVRIEAGGYGECVHCGEPVQDKRLEAVPWARHCLRCQDLQERGLLNEDEE